MTETDPGATAGRHFTGTVNHFEDFEIGRRFSHHWGRTIEAAEAIGFATEHLLHEPALFNRVYARHLGYDDIVVSGEMVFSVVLGLSVEDLSESGGPFLGADNIRFHHPVHPGDTLFAVSEVMSRRESDSRPDYGVVEWETTAHNHDGCPVLSFRRTNLVGRRAAGAAE